MANPYVPPGVTVAEATAPQVVPLLTSTAELVVVGLSSGHVQRTDTVEFHGAEEEVVLPFLASTPGSKLESILKVISVGQPGLNEGKGYPETTAWEAVTAKNAIKNKGSEIAENTQVSVTYQYVPAGYYNPYRAFNFAEVQNRYGNALTESGTVESALSLAAQKAFENGARSVICQPLFWTSSKKVEYEGGNISNAKQPTSASKEFPKVETWETTLEALNMVEAIDLLVPVIGLSESTELTKEKVEKILNAFVVYEAKRAEEQQYVVSIMGLDSTAKNGGKKSEVHTIANNIRAFSFGNYGLAQQNVIINTTAFAVQAPSKALTQAVGGQFMAAAVAGAVAGKAAATAMTRKSVTGFVGVIDQRTPAEKNEDAEAGLFVIELVKGEVIRCRQGLTTDITNISRGELSVVRAKFNMIESIRETLENQIIGQIIADANSPIIVRSAISGVLNQLASASQIVSYETPVCQLISLEPATITAAFSYRPAFTLNHIAVIFSLNLSSQTVTVVEKSETSV